MIALYLMSLKTDDDTYKEMSTYDGARSSIMHLMKQDNVYPDHQFKKKLCNLLKGFRWTVQQQKVELGLSLDDGKDPSSLFGLNWVLSSNRFLPWTRFSRTLAHIDLS